MDELQKINESVRVLLLDLMNAKTTIDQDPAVRLSRKLQGAITRCSELVRQTESLFGAPDEPVAEDPDKTIR